MSVFEMRFLRLWEEVRGPFTHIEERDGQLLATIADLDIALPCYLKDLLKGHVSHTITILRTDSDYRFRCLDEETRNAT
jgi:hypothetical protein